MEPRDGLPSRKSDRPMPMCPLNRSYGEKESICRRSRDSSSDAKVPRIMLPHSLIPMTFTPWLLPPAAPERPHSSYTPTLNTPLRLECPFSARIPRATCSATMRALPKTAMDIRSQCWICETPPGQTATTCSILSTSIWTFIRLIPVIWLQRLRRRNILRSWPRP